METEDIVRRKCEEKRPPFSVLIVFVVIFVADTFSTQNYSLNTSLQIQTSIGKKSARKVNFCGIELKGVGFLLLKMLYYHLDFYSTLLLLILMCFIKFTVCCINEKNRNKMCFVMVIFVLIGQSHKIFDPFLGQNSFWRSWVSLNENLAAEER